MKPRPGRLERTLPADRRRRPRGPAPREICRTGLRSLPLQYRRELDVTRIRAESSGLLRTGRPVSARPSQVEMLELPQLPLGRHDFHFLAVRRLRRDRICGLLPADAAGLSGPAAGLRQPVLLRVWPAGTAGVAGRRGFRNLPLPGPGTAKPEGLASGRHRLQSRAARVLQIQTAVHRSGVSQPGGLRAA